jgi:hypothetical protein
MNAVDKEVWQDLILAVLTWNTQLWRIRQDTIYNIENRSAIKLEYIYLAVLTWNQEQIEGCKAE